MRFLFWMNLNEHVVLPILKWTVLSKDWIPVIVVKLLPVLHVHVIVDRGVGRGDHHLVPVVLLHLQLLLLLVAEDVVDAVGDDVSEGVAGADGSGATVGIWHEWILLNIASRFSINIATTDKMKIVKMMITGRYQHLLWIWDEDSSLSQITLGLATSWHTPGWAQAMRQTSVRIQTLTRVV